VELDYTIRRSTRARRVRVAVDAHDGVQVTLPARAREREAALAVAELRPWIERRLAEVRAARERLAVPAGHVPYLGAHLVLRPRPAACAPTAAATRCSSRPTSRARRSSAGTGARRAPRSRRASTRPSPPSARRTRS
jgi:predicted metal-dependent hydrolase